MGSVNEILEELKSKARPDQLEGMAKFGISVEKRLGVRVPELRKLAQTTGKDHNLALKLWNTGFDDAHIVASMIAEPDKLTGQQMEEWVSEFNSWDVCDQVCMNLFDKSPMAWRKVREWSKREEEFVKRAAFTLIACLAWHDKGAEDSNFTDFFPVIREGAKDQRNYVKKAVSWALRHIGKRNPELNQAAIEEAKLIGEMDYSSARWVAKDVIKELESETVQKRLAQEGT